MLRFDIYMHQNPLERWDFAGDFDTYIRTRGQLEENQMKKYAWEQEQIAHMKEYIARFGHGSAKLARQAQSKEKTLEKMVRSGLTEKVATDQVIRIKFTDVPKLPPPVLQFSEVTFGYSPDKILYSNVSALSSGSITLTLDWISMVESGCSENRPTVLEANRFSRG